MSRKLGVIRFPGSNCDFDLFKAAQVTSPSVEWLWHKDHFDENSYDGLFVPGGFSYGDYLRSGAMASRSSACYSLSKAAKRGVPILGICNGFQILTEMELLPGALVANESRRFIDRWIELNQVSEFGFWGKLLKGKKQRVIPIAHGEGRYYNTESETQSLFDNNQVIFTYGNNPNGSLRDIAGICNDEGNILGLMPHPERSLYDWMGGADGYDFFDWSSN